MPNRCYLCKEEEKTNDHLILFCKKATMLWSLLFSLFDVQWVLHSSIKRNLIGWHGAFLQTQTTRIGGKGNREVERGWTTREVRDSYRLSLWKDISKSWDKFTLKANIRIGFLPTRMQQWQIYGEGEEVEVDVGRFLLEDPSKIGSKRRCLGFWNTSFLQKCKKGRTL
ncbi:hypothetical protein CK203_103411 [Vitis vinifera]|uniref:Reverse transcriptase zinc-binding domain-containing protein n=1 Tax=Vitis vinifera TaxID=29760 RepID=A0A438BQR0_VITVI|nr:hypothetical protein CK203_103411 [Vitis vinifera]